MYYTVLKSKVANGIIYTEKAMGHDYTNYNYYYDYQTTICQTIDENGTTTESSSRILYNNGVKSKEGVWFGGDDAGDTKWDLSFKSGIMFTGTAPYGKGGEPRKIDPKMLEDIINVDEITAIFNTGRGVNTPLGGDLGNKVLNILANAAQLINTAATGMDGGGVLVDTVNETFSDDEQQQTDIFFDNGDTWGSVNANGDTVSKYTRTLGTYEVENEN